MKDLRTLPGWSEVLSKASVADEESGERLLAPTRVDLPKASKKIHRLETDESARDFVEMLKATPVAAIALDSEYTFGGPEIELKRGQHWNDIRTQYPICVSVAAWVTEYDGAPRGYVLRAVLDVRQSGVVAALVDILRLRVPFVFHHIKVELFTFWALGLDPDLHHVYDTFLAAACLHLGLDHPRSHGLVGEDNAEEIGAQADLARRKARRLSLVGQCESYDLGYPFSDSKDELRDTFLDMTPEERLSDRAIKYASADAEWTLRLYVAQQPDVLRAGIDGHLRTVEFPFASANARIEWRGVYISAEKREQLRGAASRAAKHHAKELRAFGIDPAGSNKKFLGVMTGAGLTEHFRRNGKLTTKKEVLEELENLHPAIRPFRLCRQYRRLAGEEWLTGMLTGSDGRTHPLHRQLGADTGRNSCSTPNLAGIGKIFRPIVTAPAGRALLELDYSQIEVGVAAAEHDDPDLIEAFNSGDVYAAMAQRFYADRLTSDERGLSAHEFERRRSDLRDKMKTFVLAVIYNIQAPAIAARFGISLREAERERARFLDMFPVLKRRLEESSAYGAVRGYGSVVSGLRRLAERARKPNSWMRNFMRNTPIQGSAAVVFKAAIVRLDKAFRGTEVWLVLPVHDSILIECPDHEVEEVSTRAAQILEDAVRDYYPKLKPKVDVNRSHPECWNKDGRADSLNRFLDDPSFRLDVLESVASAVPDENIDLDVALSEHLRHDLDVAAFWELLNPQETTTNAGPDRNH